MYGPHWLVVKGNVEVGRFTTYKEATMAAEAAGGVRFSDMVYKVKEGYPIIITRVISDPF